MEAHDIPMRYANVPYFEKPFSLGDVCRALQRVMCRAKD